MASRRVSEAICSWTSSCTDGDSSDTRSPSDVSPSSPTGLSRLTTARSALRISITSASGRSATAAISSSLGSWPSFVVSSRSMRPTLRERCATWTGSRIVRLVFSSPRWIACRIHSVA